MHVPENQMHHCGQQDYTTGDSTNYSKRSPPLGGKRWRIPPKKCFPITLMLLVPSAILFMLHSHYDLLHLAKGEQHHKLYLFAQRLLKDKVEVDTAVADQLKDKVRVLCFVTTIPANQDRAVAVNTTWLKRCTRHLFVLSSPMPIFKRREVLYQRNVPEGRDHLTAKTFSALNHLYHHELNNYDWFLKADDDVYIIMENMRLMMSKYSPDNPVYLGFHFKRNTPQGYMSGGASYSLSRGALTIMGEKGIPQNGGICRTQEPDEDVEVGHCMHQLGIKTYRTIDKHGRETFHPWTIPDSLFSDHDKNYELHKKVLGPDCCSQLTTTFHYVDPHTMYLMDMLLYHIDVYGRHAKDKDLEQNLFVPEVELLH